MREHISGNASEFSDATTQQFLAENSQLMYSEKIEDLFNYDCILPKLSRYIFILKYLSFVGNSSFYSFSHFVTLKLFICTHLILFMHTTRDNTILSSSNMTC